MLKYRRAFLRQRRAAITIQACVKGVQARSAYAELLRWQAAATAVQAAYRGHVVRQEYLLQRDAAIAVQTCFRRRQVSCTVASLHAFRLTATAQSQCYPHCLGITAGRDSATWLHIPAHVHIPCKAIHITAVIE